MAYDVIIGRNEADKKNFGERGLIYIGKGYVRMGQYTSLSNRILMDVARSHVILVAGKRGSGKCLHGDTLITLSDGSVKKINELGEDRNKILSLNEKLKIKLKSDLFNLVYSEYNKKKKTLKEKKET